MGILLTLSLGFVRISSLILIFLKKIKVKMLWMPRVVRGNLVISGSIVSVGNCGWENGTAMLQSSSGRLNRENGQGDVRRVGWGPLAD